MPLGNMGLQGQPQLPYTDVRSYAGSDVFIDLSFLDHTATPVVPTALWYQIDDLTNAQNMVPQTQVTAGLAAQMTLQIPGSVMQMSYPYQGSQICQISYWFSAIDSVTLASFNATKVDVVELVAIMTPTNTPFP
jgi:hypothetical protein